MLALLRLAVKPYPRYHRDHDYPHIVQRYCTRELYRGLSAMPEAEPAADRNGEGSFCRTKMRL